jgi:hypothetical protein
MHGPALTLSDAHRTLSPLPLVEEAEFNAFYRDGINRLRGQDLVKRMAHRLRQIRKTKSFFKGVLMGHAGAGKSTELTRLTRVPEVLDSFRVIRFGLATNLDPSKFQPFDVLLLMIYELLKRTYRLKEEGVCDRYPSKESLAKLEEWFVQTKVTSFVETSGSLTAAGGVGLDDKSLWAGVLGIFGKVAGEMRYSGSRKTETVSHSLSRLDDLTQAANQILDECNELLRQASGHEWLFIGEEFDKPEVAPRAAEDFFITYSNVLRDLRAHFIFTLPVAIGYSDKADRLPIQPDLTLCLPDIMVFNRDLSPHTEGRAAIQELLDARIHPALFGPKAQEYLITASGGNLRDLFGLVLTAAYRADDQGSNTIQREHARFAIRERRTWYQRRLGDSLYELQAGIPQPSYEEKATCLVNLYKGNAEAQIPSPALYALLRARAVLEFNGERWFGVHPLVVDILVGQGRIERPLQGPVPGGTE